MNKITGILTLVIVLASACAFAYSGNYYDWEVNQQDELVITQKTRTRDNPGILFTSESLLMPFSEGYFKELPEPESITASSFVNQEFSPQSCTDNLLTTKWMIAKSQISELAKSPLTIISSEPRQLTGIDINQTGLNYSNYYGRWKSVTFYFDGNQKLEKQNLPSNSNLQHIDFGRTITSRNIKIVITSYYNSSSGGSGDSQNDTVRYLGCSELTLYDVNGQVPKDTLTASGPFYGETLSPEKSHDGQEITHWMCRSHVAEKWLNFKWNNSNQFDAIEISQLAVAANPWKNITLSFDGRQPSLHFVLENTFKTQQVILPTTISSSSLKIRVDDYYPEGKNFIGCSEIKFLKLNSAHAQLTNPTVCISNDADAFRYTKIYNNDYLLAKCNYKLYRDKRYIDVDVELKYQNDKEIAYEGVELKLAKNSPIEYMDNAFKKQRVRANQDVFLSQWSPRYIKILPSLSLIIDKVEAIEISSKDRNSDAIAVYSYFSPLREHIYNDYYSNPLPQPSSGIKRKPGEIVHISLRMFIGDEELNFMPFRYPYAKNSVISFTEHADFCGTNKAAEENLYPDQIREHPIKKTLAAFYGTSDKNSPDYMKKGLVAHNLRASITVWPVNDEISDQNNNAHRDYEYYGTLENGSFFDIINDLYRYGMDVGAHRLTYTNMASLKDTQGNTVSDSSLIKNEITKAFAIISPFNPKLWIDHGPVDCRHSRTEAVSGCGSDKTSCLYVIDKLKENNWKYVWSSGQDYPYNHALNGFESNMKVPPIAYYFQKIDDSDTNGDPLLMFAASKYFYKFHRNLTEDNLERLSNEKGFHNYHIYFRKPSSNINYINGLPDDPAILDNIEWLGLVRSVETPGHPIEWSIEPKWEEKLVLLEAFQNQDKLWVRDFTSVANYLMAWSKVKVEDFGNAWVQIRNTSDEPIDGLTIYSPATNISTAVDSEGNYFPWIKNMNNGINNEGYVVLPELQPNESKRIYFGAGDPGNSKPRLINVSNKQIAVFDCSYSEKDNKLKIEIGSYGAKVPEKTNILLKLPFVSSYAVFRNGVSYSDYSYNREQNELLINSEIDSQQHYIFEIYTSKLKVENLAISNGPGGVNEPVTFVSTFSDSSGWRNIKYADIIVGTALWDKAKRLVALYNAGNNRIYIRDDSGTGWLGGVSAGTNYRVKNSSTVDSISATALGSQDKLIVTWRVQFKNSFTGAKNVYLYVRDKFGRYDGWAQKGTFILGRNYVPQADLFLPGKPAINSGQAGELTCEYSDANGFQDIKLAYLRIEAADRNMLNTGSRNPERVLYTFYDRTLNRIHLMGDDGQWLPAAVLGSSVMLENAQVIIDCAGTSIVGEGDKLKVKWKITFKPPLAGAKDVYLYAKDFAGASSGWKKKGTCVINYSGRR